MVLLVITTQIFKSLTLSFDNYAKDFCLCQMLGVGLLYLLTPPIPVPRVPLHPGPRKFRSHSHFIIAEKTYFRR